MDKTETARWIAERFWDRLSKPSGLKRARWRLDGEIRSIDSVCSLLVAPAIRAGEIRIDFPHNSSSAYAVMEQVRYQRCLLEEGYNE